MTTKSNEFKKTEIGEIPSDWAVRTLRALCSPKKQQMIPTDGGSNRYIGLEHLDSGRSTINRWGIESGLKSSKNQFASGDILYGKLRPYLDKSAVAPWPGICSTDILVLSALKNECLGEYLGFLLHTPEFLAYAKATTKGVNHPRTSWEDLKKFAYGIPEKTEQGKIANALSKLQKATEKQERIVADLRELKAATAARLFREGLQGEPLKNTEVGEMPRSWQAALLSAVCADTGTLNPGKDPDKMIEYVDVSSVSREECRILSSTRYKGKDAPGRARNLVKYRDVIFATVRPTLRRVALIPKDFDGQLVSTAFCVIRAIEPKAYPEYLYYVVSSPTFIAQVGRLERGANYPAVTNTNVLSQKIPLPGYDEQKEIASELMKIDKALSSNTEKAKHLSDLFTVTLNHLMTGKVRMK